MWNEIESRRWEVLSVARALPSFVVVAILCSFPPHHAVFWRHQLSQTESFFRCPGELASSLSETFAVSPAPSPFCSPLICVLPSLTAILMSVTAPPSQQLQSGSSKWALDTSWHWHISVQIKKLMPAKHQAAVFWVVYLFHASNSAPPWNLARISLWVHLENVSVLILPSFGWSLLCLMKVLLLVDICHSKIWSWAGIPQHCCFLCWVREGGSKLISAKMCKHKDTSRTCLGNFVHKHHLQKCAECPFRVSHTNEDKVCDVSDFKYLIVWGKGPRQSHTNSSNKRCRKSLKPLLFVQKVKNTTKVPVCFFKFPSFGHLWKNLGRVTGTEPWKLALISAEMKRAPWPNVPVPWEKGFAVERRKVAFKIWRVQQNFASTMWKEALRFDQNEAKHKVRWSVKRAQHHSATDVSLAKLSLQLISGLSWKMTSFEKYVWSVMRIFH